MPGLEDRVTELEEKVERQRIAFNALNENVIKLFNAVIQLGFRGEDHERRLEELEALC